MFIPSCLYDEDHRNSLEARLESSFKAFQDYDFENPETRRLALVYDEWDRPSLVVIDRAELSAFSMIDNFISGAASLEKVALFVQTYLIRNFSDNVKDSQRFGLQCAHLHAKVKRHNQTSYFSKIDFPYPFQKNELTLRVTYPETSETLREGLSFKETEIKVSFTPTTTFAKVERRLIPWSSYCILDEINTDSVMLDTEAKTKRIWDWLTEEQENVITVTYNDIDMDKYRNFLAYRAIVEHQRLVSEQNNFPESYRRM
jgi:hypothetical protein